MAIDPLITIIHRLIQLLTLAVVIYVILSYFTDYSNPVRRTMARFIEPVLQPIRRLLPRTSALDFSPMILILVLYFFDLLITSILASFR